MSIPVFLNTAGNWPPELEQVKAPVKGDLVMTM
jgi:hypothetical protein